MLREGLTRNFIPFKYKKHQLKDEKGILCNKTVTVYMSCFLKSFVANMSYILMPDTPEMSSHFDAGIAGLVVLYGCETWSLTLREERKLRVFENIVMRGIFGPRDEVTGEWRRLHNEELNDLYSSPNNVRVIKSRRMRWVGHVARMGEERGCIGSWW